MSILDQMDLPYTYPEKDGSSTSGHSGTDTSEEQARPPKRAEVQQIVRGAVTRHADSGATIAELRRWYPDHHHGSLSSALTNLHRDGWLARLEEKRDRCHVYVAPIYVKGRATQPAVRRKPATEVVGTEGPIMGEGALRALQRTAEGIGYQKGLKDGRRDGYAMALVAVEEFVDRLIESVRIQTGPVPADATAYSRHPVAALRAVKKFLANRTK